MSSASGAALAGRAGVLPADEGRGGGLGGAWPVEGADGRLGRAWLVVGGVWPADGALGSGCSSCSSLVAAAVTVNKVCKQW